MRARAGRVRPDLCRQKAQPNAERRRRRRRTRRGGKGRVEETPTPARNSESRIYISALRFLRLREAMGMRRKKVSSCLTHPFLFGYPFEKLRMQPWIECCSNFWSENGFSVGWLRCWFVYDVVWRSMVDINDLFGSCKGLLLILFEY